MSTGLEVFLQTAEQNSEKHQAQFLTVAARLARGEDVTAKAISDACKNAGKTPADLTTAIGVANELLGCAAIIETQRTAAATAVERYQQLDQAFEEANRKFEDIRRQMLAADVEIGLWRRGLADLEGPLPGLVADAQRAAQRMAKLNADGFGIDIPQIADYPDRPAGFCKVRQRGQFEWVNLTYDRQVITAVKERLQPAPVIPVPVPPAVESSEAARTLPEPATSVSNPVAAPPHAADEDDILDPTALTK